MKESQLHHISGWVDVLRTHGRQTKTSHAFALIALGPMFTERLLIKVSLPSLTNLQVGILIPVSWQGVFARHFGPGTDSWTSRLSCWILAP